ncbi:carbonic anhydrase [Saccharopolyspora gloriosae]|uniref:carbonic anhydrase n=1 Tax=Saccharopolyspora gloriosae TaxID=455344 RepID=UPI001FB7AAF1|nr:carbonic anhydrase [Saccharopolyspora gloriosae]
MVSEAHRRELATGQQPVALFITCSDSRVMPSKITGAEPGKLFELRTAGNVVPHYVPDSASSEMATIEYAVLQLQVPEIVVCGHSHCGAVTAKCAAGHGLEQLPAMRTWLGFGEPPTTALTAPEPGVRSESKAHVREQLDTLFEYPFIRDRVSAGNLRVHGWFYEIDTGLVFRSPDRTPDRTENVDFLPL